MKVIAGITTPAGIEANSEYFTAQGKEVYVWLMELGDKRVDPKPESKITGGKPPPVLAG